MADDGLDEVNRELSGELRDLWNEGTDDELVRDTLGEVYSDSGRDGLHELIYSMTDDPAERHALWTLAATAYEGD